jgi:hypothetical protein
MSIKSKNVLKSYFETGDKPTQTQFAALIDSLRHVWDKISYTAIEGFKWDNLTGKPNKAASEIETAVDHSQQTTGNPHAVTKSEIGLENVDNVVQIPMSQKGAANGVAETDSNNKVLISHLPDSIANGLNYKGAFDASSGSYPASPTTGDYYICKIAGTIGADVYAVGDWAVYNGSSWDKIDNSQKVSSVNGQAGEVTLNPDDLDDTSTTNKFTSQAEKNKLDNIEAGAQVNTQSDWSQIDEQADDFIKNKPSSANFHEQNTDTKLDEGGSNEVTAAQAKQAYMHSQVPHAQNDITRERSSAEINAGVLTLDFNSKHELILSKNGGGGIDVAGDFTLSAANFTNAEAAQVFLSIDTTTTVGITLSGNMISSDDLTALETGEYQLVMTYDGGTFHVVISEPETL